MIRRKYLATVGLATILGLAGCTGDTDGNSSSGGGGSGGGGGGDGDGSGGGGGGGGGDTQGGGGGETEASSGGATEANSAETTAASGESGGGEGTSDNGGGSITDSGDTDVELQDVRVTEGLSLDSVAFYVEDAGFSAGVRGEVTNTTDSAMSYLEIDALFYDSEGSRLGDGLDNLNDFKAGETYKYDALYLGSNDASQIASYSLEVSNGF